jgi:SAM-dependent methyltransferase
VTADDVRAATHLDANIPKRERRAADFILRFCTDIVHLESLHFGLWEDDYPRTIDGLRLAQKNYTRELLSRIPSSARRILDVGCGTGELSDMLADRGYAVTALTPDPYLAEIVTRRLAGRGSFVLTKFEDFCDDEKYDLIVMSESSQYLSHHLMFPKIRELLAEGGRVLISDYYRKHDTAYYETVWTNAEFEKKAAANGFAIASCEDVTARCLPTLDVGHACLTDIMLPTIELVRDLLLHVIPTFVTRAVRFGLRKQLSLVADFLYVKQLAQFDSARFQREIEYKIMLLSCRTEGVDGS